MKELKDRQTQQWKRSYFSRYPTDQLITESFAASILGTRKRFLMEARKLGITPPYEMRNGEAFYRRSEIHKWAYQLYVELAEARGLTFLEEHRDADQQ